MRNTIKSFQIFWCCTALTAILSCAQCEDDDLDRLRPVLEFEPAKLEFGPRTIGQSHTLSTLAKSLGSLDLKIESVTIEPDHAPFVVNNYPDFLAISKTEEISVTFTPGERGEYTADAVFIINYDEKKRVRLPLSGEVGPPRIDVDPEQLDFGVVNQDTGLALPIKVTNVGHDWLHISAVDFATATTEFTLASSSMGIPKEIAPGDYDLLQVRYVPDNMGEDSNTLRITSNADNGPVTEVPLEAVGNLSPVAVAFEIYSQESEVSVDPEDQLTLSSQGTYDPEGEQVTLHWQIIQKPAGTRATLSETATVETQITPGLVGDYTVRLLATDPNGAQGYADVIIHAIRDVVVRLTWDTAPGATCRGYSEQECASMDPVQRQSLCCGQTDIDLHLVAPGGSVGDYWGTCPSETGCSQALCGCSDPATNPACATCQPKGLDCAYANRQSDWGTIADPLDDPSLDVDDVRGAGPEIISLNGPVDGDYMVYVHFCNDRIGEPTDATIEVFIKGSPLFDAAVPITQRLQAQDKLWLAAVLTKTGENWSGLTPASVSDADPNLCNQ